MLQEENPSYNREVSVFLLISFSELPETPIDDIKKAYPMAIFHLGEKVGCANCVRGHRAIQCNHLCKFLFGTGKRGRPSTSNNERKETFRFRIDPNPETIVNCREYIVSKKKGKARKYHRIVLKDDVPGCVYKVSTQGTFLVERSATPEETANFVANQAYKLNLKTEFPPQGGYYSKTKRRTGQKTTEVGPDISYVSRSSSVFSVKADELASPTRDRTPSVEDVDKQQLRKRTKSIYMFSDDELSEIEDNSKAFSSDLDLIGGAEIERNINEQFGEEKVRVFQQISCD